MNDLHTHTHTHMYRHLRMKIHMHAILRCYLLSAYSEAVAHVEMITNRWWMSDSRLKPM